MRVRVRVRVRARVRARVCTHVRSNHLIVEQSKPFELSVSNLNLKPISETHTRTHLSYAHVCSLASVRACTCTCYVHAHVHARPALAHCMR